MEIITAELAHRVLKNKIAKDVEEFWALALGPKKNLISCRMLFRGTADACLVHPRDVFRFACLQNASSILVAHNHPSGDSLPSHEDIRFTRQLVQAARVLEIPIVDHLILTTRGFASLSRDGWCQFEERLEADDGGEPEIRSSVNSRRQDETTRRCPR